MQRIQSTRDLSVTKGRSDSPERLQLDVLRQNVKALIRASRSFENLTTLVCL